MKNNSNVKIITTENNLTPEIGLSTLLTTGGDSFVHYHPYYEIFYVTYGEITHTFNSINRNLSIGDLIILKPMDIHYFHRKKSDAIHRDIMIDINLFKSICNLIPSAEDIINNSNTSLQVKLSKSEIERLEDIVNNFVSQKNVATKKCYGMNLVVEILCKYLRQYHASQITNENDKPTKLLQNILETFNRTDSLSKSISDIIKPFGYTHSYLCKFFKKETGITLTQYFNNVKLNRAVYFLENTNMTIQAICEKIGIYSTSYFNKIFKKEFHVSPTEYIKQKRNPY